MRFYLNSLTWRSLIKIRHLPPGGFTPFRPGESSRRQRRITYCRGSRVASFKQEAPEAVGVVLGHANGVPDECKQVPIIESPALWEAPADCPYESSGPSNNLGKAHESNQFGSSEGRPNRYPRLWVFGRHLPTLLAAMPRVATRTKCKDRRMQRKTCNWSVVGATTWSSDATIVARPHTWTPREIFPPWCRVAPANVELLPTARSGRHWQPFRRDWHAGRSPAHTGNCYPGPV